MSKVKLKLGKSHDAVRENGGRMHYSERRLVITSEIMMSLDSVSPSVQVRSIAMSVSVCLSVCPLAYLNKCSAVAEMGDRLATIDTG